MIDELFESSKAMIEKENYPVILTLTEVTEGIYTRQFFLSTHVKIYAGVYIYLYVITYILYVYNICMLCVNTYIPYTCIYYVHYLLYLHVIYIYMLHNHMSYAYIIHIYI